MAKHAGLIVALSLALAPAAASALEIQKYPLPDGAAQNFTDPDEKQPVLGYSERDMDNSPAVRSGGRGFNFSLSGGSNANGANPNFIQGWTVPRQFGPALDPQTGDRYPGR
jgi:hypothetical protein